MRRVYPAQMNEIRTRGTTTQEHEVTIRLAAGPVRTRADLPFTLAALPNQDRGHGRKN